MIIWILSVLERLPSRSRIISRPIAETTDVPVCSSATRKLKPRKESPLAARFLGSARVKRRIKASYTGSREAQLLHACPRNHLERPPYASRVHTREFTCRTGGCACVRAPLAGAAPWWPWLNVAYLPAKYASTLLCTGCMRFCRAAVSRGARRRLAARGNRETYPRGQPGSAHVKQT